VRAAGLGVVNTMMASVVERRGGPDGRVKYGDRNRCGLRDRGYHPYLSVAATGGEFAIWTTGPRRWMGVRAALAIGLFGWLVVAMIGELAGLPTANGMLRRRRLVHELQVERH